MLKISRSTESTTRPEKGGVGVGGDGDDGGGDDGGDDSGNDGVITSMLRMSSSTDSSTSATQIVVDYDGVDGGVVGKSVKKSSKSRRIVKKSEKSQRPERLQRSLVWRNVYRSTNPPSIRYEELELPLEL